MNFIEVDNTEVKRNGEVLRMLSAFMQSDTEVAEVKDWESDYKDLNTVYSAVRGAVNKCYPGQVRVSRLNGKLYMEKKQ